MQVKLLAIINPFTNRLCSAILTGLFERKYVLYMPCLVLIDLSIPLVIQGFLNCFCLLWDINFLGTCLSTIKLESTYGLGCNFI